MHICVDVWNRHFYFHLEVNACERLHLHKHRWTGRVVCVTFGNKIIDHISGVVHSRSKISFIKI